MYVHKWFDFIPEYTVNAAQRNKSTPYTNCDNDNVRQIS